MERLTSAGLRELLERIGPALTNGSANVISVVAIRDYSGSKWARKRELVEEFIERAFARVCPEGGLLVALNDIEYLAMHGEVARWPALNRSAAILRETLTFFVGKAEHQDIRLMAVTGFNDGELAIQTVNPATLPAADEPPLGYLSRGGDDSVPPMTELCGRERERVRLVADAQEVEARHAAVPTWNVRDKVVTSFLVETTTEPRPTAELTPLLAAEVARSSLAFAVQQIREGQAAGTPVALHVPVPLAALSMAAGRYALLHRLRDLPADVRRLLLMELTDVPDGAPQARFSEAVTMFKPYARAVLARAPSETSNILQWGRCGLHGITLDCAGFDNADPGALARLGTFARNALALAPACVGYSLSTMTLLVSAWGAGFTHLGGAAVSSEVRELAPVRLPPENFYARVA
jgi:hypothetical protein